jgi:hypothetical protein
VAAAAGSGNLLEACLPVGGPLLAHFRVSTQQQQQQQQQQGGVTGSCDYLLLLVPIGEHHLGAAGVAGVQYLPGHLLLPPTATAEQQQQQQQQQRIVVEVSKALPCEPTAAGGAPLSHIVQQHSQYVSCVYEPSLQDCIPCNHQQQQISWLDPAEYPWLNPALQAGVQRLKPRLDLLTWQSWQSVDLPLPGGVLLVGASEGGRGWLMQLIGQEAAITHGAHVLKVGFSCCQQSGLVLCLWHMCDSVGPAAAVPDGARGLVMDVASHQQQLQTRCSEIAYVCVQLFVCGGPRWGCLVCPRMLCRCPARALLASPMRQLQLCWPLLLMMLWRAALVCCCWMTWSCSCPRPTLRAPQDWNRCADRRRGRKEGGRAIVCGWAWGLLLTWPVGSASAPQTERATGLAGLTPS